MPRTALTYLAVLCLLPAPCIKAGADDAAPASTGPEAGAQAAADPWVDGARGLAWEMAWTISDIYFHRADYTGTFYSLLAAVAANPRDPDAYICAGVMLLSMDKEEDSLKMRLIGLEYTRDLFDVWHDLGFWYFDRQDFATARGYFEEATKRPCPPFVWKMWAHACEHDGDLEKALEIWETVRGITPDDPVIEMNMDRIRKIMGEDAPQTDDKS